MYLKSLKFWTEDINQMNKTVTAALFTDAVLKYHIRLLSLQDNGDQVELTIDPDFIQDNWEGFVISTSE